MSGAGALPEFASLDEVRAEIDRVDDEIVRLIARRTACVDQVARFKRTADDVHDPARARQVVERGRERAVRLGADPDLVADLYRLLIERFSDRQRAAIGRREG